MKTLTILIALVLLNTLCASSEVEQISQRIDGTYSILNGGSGPARITIRDGFVCEGDWDPDAKNMHCFRIEEAAINGDFIALFTEYTLFKNGSEIPEEQRMEILAALREDDPTAGYWNIGLMKDRFIHMGSFYIRDSD